MKQFDIDSSETVVVNGTALLKHLRVLTFVMLNLNGLVVISLLCSLAQAFNYAFLNEGTFYHLYLFLLFSVSFYVSEFFWNKHFLKRVFENE